MFAIFVPKSCVFHSCLSVPALCLSELFSLDLFWYLPHRLPVLLSGLKFYLIQAPTGSISTLVTCIWVLLFASRNNIVISISCLYTKHGETGSRWKSWPLRWFPASHQGTWKRRKGRYVAESYSGSDCSDRCTEVSGRNTLKPNTHFREWLNHWVSLSTRCLFLVFVERRLLVSV